MIQYAATSLFFFFFFNDTATTEIYTLSLHDALPISIARCSMRSGGCDDLAGRTCWRRCSEPSSAPARNSWPPCPGRSRGTIDRKSTRLNSSHGYISYAVFCLKKKKKESQ